MLESTGSRLGPLSPNEFMAACSRNGDIAPLVAERLLKRFAGTLVGQVLDDVYEKGQPLAASSFLDTLQHRLDTQSTIYAFDQKPDGTFSVHVVNTVESDEDKYLIMYESIQAPDFPREDIHTAYHIWNTLGEIIPGATITAGNTGIQESPAMSETPSQRILIQSKIELVEKQGSMLHIQEYEVSVLELQGGTWKRQRPKLILWDVKQSKYADKEDKVDFNRRVVCMPEGFSLDTSSFDNADGWVTPYDDAKGVEAGRKLYFAPADLRRSTAE